MQQQSLDWQRLAAAQLAEQGLLQADLQGLNVGRSQLQQMNHAHRSVD
jgi:hypothetical protein